MWHPSHAPASGASWGAAQPLFVTASRGQILVIGPSVAALAVLAAFPEAFRRRGPEEVGRKVDTRLHVVEAGAHLLVVRVRHRPMGQLERLVDQDPLHRPFLGLIPL